MPKNKFRKNPKERQPKAVVVVRPAKKKRLPKKKGRKANAPMSRALPAAYGARAKSHFALHHLPGGITRLVMNDIVTPFAAYRAVQDTAVVSLPFTLGGPTVYTEQVAQVLPKLHGLATVFSRYRVQHAALDYTPLCPTTYQGRLAMGIIPGDATPSRTLEELASYEHGAIGPAYMRISSPPWRPRADRWYNTENSAELAQVNDAFPFTMVFLTDGQVSTTTNLGQAGIFWLRLVIDFCDLKPISSNNLVLKAGAGEFLGGSPTVDRVIEWADMIGGSGLWGWAGAVARSFYNGATATPLPNKSWFDVEGGSEYLINAAIGLDAVDVSDDKSDDFKIESEPRPVTKTVLLSCRNLKEARLAARRPQVMQPNAAGDVTISLYCQAQTGDVVAIASQVFSSGTGAIVCDFAHSWEEAEACTLFYTILPTGVENRGLNVAKSAVSISKISPSALTL